MNTLTCVYCGHEYPEGTPPHGSQILTNHIKVCEKHPMRELEKKAATVRAALIRLIGASSHDELVAMKAVVSIMPKSDEQDAAVCGINALLETES